MACHWVRVDVGNGGYWFKQMIRMIDNDYDIILTLMMMMMVVVVVVVVVVMVVVVVVVVC